MERGATTGAVHGNHEGSGTARTKASGTCIDARVSEEHGHAHGRAGGPRQRRSQGRRARRGMEREGEDRLEGLCAPGGYRLERLFASGGYRLEGLFASGGGSEM